MSIFQIKFVPQTVIFFISMLPLVELRGSIVLAINLFKLTQIEALFLGVAGSVFPAIPILLFLEFIEPYFRKIKEIDSLLNRIYAKTQNKSDLIQRYKSIGLILFIGIPLPGTGVWTGMLAAYLLKLNKLVAFICALIGTTIAGVIMIFMADFKNIFSVVGAIAFVVVVTVIIKLQLRKEET